ncbi:hypothetical protein ABH924_002501 [Arthrobacter sp. GAS37]
MLAEEGTERVGVTDRVAAAVVIEIDEDLLAREFPPCQPMVDLI